MAAIDAEDLAAPWRAQAECRFYDPRAFHPPLTQGRPPENPAPTSYKKICASCPVKRECLRASKGSPGVWGGLNDTERWQLFGKGWLWNVQPPTNRGLAKLDAYWKEQDELNVAAASGS